MKKEVYINGLAFIDFNNHYQNV
uniref:Uncharacterized protein n=1 Tax=Anguilla anguilla TaxID=7936 RepID=A0A0E9RZS0_ANGAN